MPRCLAFAIALLSASVSWHDGFADGFLLLSGVPTSISAPSSTLSTSVSSTSIPTSTSIQSFNSRYPRSDPRKDRRRSGNSIHRHTSATSIIQRRTRNTRLFSQTTRPSTEQHEPPTPRARAKTKSETKLITKQKSETKITKPTTITSPIPKPKQRPTQIKFNASKFAVTEGPDLTTKPDYENIHGPLGKNLDNVFLYVFRSQLAHHVGVDSKLPKTDYAGLMELSAAMNARYSDRKQIQDIAQQTLRSLFPGWLPPWFAILFAGPFPEFSSRMNAWATWVAGQWLMGECEINDIEIDGKTMEGQGLLVKRCRFLEESGCASVCVNSCKIPTQKFFIEDMGLPLTMTPDYETHECQFSFGRAPTEQDDLDAIGTPCLSRCPTAGSMRQWHNGNSNGDKNSNGGSGRAASFLDGSTPPPELKLGGQCAFMENPPGDDDDQTTLQP